MLALWRERQANHIRAAPKKQCIGIIGDESKGDPFQTADLVHLEVLTNEQPGQGRLGGPKIDPRRWSIGR